MLPLWGRMQSDPLPSVVDDEPFAWLADFLVNIMVSSTFLSPFPTPPKQIFVQASDQETLRSFYEMYSVIYTPSLHMCCLSVLCHHSSTSTDPSPLPPSSLPTPSALMFVFICAGKWPRTCMWDVFCSVHEWEMVSLITYWCEYAVRNRANVRHRVVCIKARFYPGSCYSRNVVSR